MENEKNILIPFSEKEINDLRKLLYETDQYSDKELDLEDLISQNEILRDIISIIYYKIR